PPTPRSPWASPRSRPSRACPAPACSRCARASTSRRPSAPAGPCRRSCGDTSCPIPPPRHRAGRAAAGLGDPADLHTRLPRLRRPAAHPRMVAADLRGPRLRRHRLVADPAARPRGRRRGAVDQPPQHRHRREGTGMSAQPRTQTQTAAPSPDDARAQPLLEISDLSVAYRTRRGVVEAVRGIDVPVARGSVTALVGESGSGKSTAAQSAIGLLADNGTVTGGSITLTGADGRGEQLVGLPERAWRE